MNKIDAEITRWPRGWNCKTMVYWDGSDKPAITYSGSTTLGGTLFHEVIDLALRCEAKLGNVLVDGKDWTPQDTIEKVKKYLKGTVCENYMDRLNEVL